MHVSLDIKTFQATCSKEMEQKEAGEAEVGSKGKRLMKHNSQ